MLWFQFHWIFVPKGPIDNKSVLVQVMAWRRRGDKPLPEPMLAQFPDAYMRHFETGFSTGLIKQGMIKTHA